MKKLEDFQSHKIETKSVLGGLIDAAKIRGTKYTDGNGCTGTDLWDDKDGDGMYDHGEIYARTLD